MLNTPSSTWNKDKAEWRALYSDTLPQQIDRTILRIKKNKKNPEILLRHFDSMLQLFEQALSHPKPATQLKLIDFVQALHPLPVWWGKWSEWMRVLDKTSFVAQKNNKTKRELWLYLTQSELSITGGDAKKALIFAEKALHLAMLFQNQEMIFQAEMAIFEAKKDLGQIGDRISAISALEKALNKMRNLLPEKASQILEVKFLLKKTDVLRRIKRKEEAALTVQKAHRIASKNFDENNPLLAQVYNRRGATYWTAEKNSLAIADFEKATDIFKSCGDKTSQLYSIGYTGLVSWSAGEYRKAERILQSSINIAEDIKALQWQAIQIGNLGLVYYTRGKLSQAIAFMKQYYMLSDLINNNAEKMRASGNIGYAQVFLGNFEDARQRLLKDIAFTEEMKFDTGSGTTYANMAWAMDGLGDSDSALEYAEKSLFMAEKTNSHLLKIVALRSLSEVQTDQNTKTRYAEEAYNLAKKHSRRFNIAGALLTLAECHEDEKLQKKAIHILEEVGSTAWLKVPLIFKSLRLPLLYWG